MDTDEEDERGPDEVVATLYGLACFLTVTVLALAEQSAQLPGAAAAFASGWFVLRRDARPDR